MMSNNNSVIVVGEFKRKKNIGLMNIKMIVLLHKKALESILLLFLNNIFKNKQSHWRRRY